jgi:hypothetical protein
MNTVIMVADVVEANGLTVRENNLNLKHNIPLYSLVETCLIGETRSHGLRLFVAWHGRDCDGTPLYGLTMDTSIIGYDLSKRSTEEERYRSIFKAGAMDFGWGESSLKIIVPGERVASSLLEEWTEKDGSIPKGVIGILETGWRFPSKDEVGRDRT